MQKIKMNCGIDDTSSDFSAQLLLDDEASVEYLEEELGIDNCVDQLRLLVRFRQDIRREPIQFPVERVVELLQEMKLGCYCESVKKFNFDGDMFLCSSTKLVIEAMQAIGIGKALDQLRILVLFRNKLQGDSCHISVDEVSSFIERHSNKVKNEFFDGDMLLFAEDALVKQALKDIGVNKCVRVRSNFKTQYGNK